MSLADVLPAVNALSRAEKLRLIQIVAGDLENDDLRAHFPPGATFHAGYGLHDCHEAAAALQRLLEEGKSQP